MKLSRRSFLLSSVALPLAAALPAAVKSGWNADWTRAQLEPLPVVYANVPSVGDSLDFRVIITTVSGSHADAVPTGVVQCSADGAPWRDVSPAKIVGSEGNIESIEAIVQLDDIW